MRNKLYFLSLIISILVCTGCSTQINSVLPLDYQIQKLIKEKSESNNSSTTTTTEESQLTDAEISLMLNNATSVSPSTDDVVYYFLAQEGISYTIYSSIEKDLYWDFNGPASNIQARKKIHVTSSGCEPIKAEKQGNIYIYDWEPAANYKLLVLYNKKKKVTLKNFN